MTRTAPALLALAVPAALVPAEQPPAADAELAALRQKVQAKLDALREQASFPGASAGFVLADGRSAGVATGRADVENKVPLKPTDRLLAGSVGKTFVAAVLLQLVEEGKVGLDDPLAKWLGKEEWFGRLPNGPDLTVRRLMNRTSGLPEYFAAKGFAAAVTADPDKVWTPADRIAYVLDAKPLFPAGKD
ncbi:MAG: beta-lactamase family protein [Gemmataceae bacterium]|nr:beta-lactamase family protein [Gemmataceae bacterium]